MTEEMRPRWSARIIEKAHEHLDAVSPDPEHPDVYWVTSTSGNQKYRVQTDGLTWVSCTCANGEHLSEPICWHSAAVVAVHDRLRNRRMTLYGRFGPNDLDDGYIPGAWDEVRRAWMAGVISDEAYELLAAALGDQITPRRDSPSESWSDRL